MKEFDSQIEKLRVLYNEKPTETINEINKAIMNFEIFFMIFLLSINVNR